MQGLLRLWWLWLPCVAPPTPLLGVLTVSYTHLTLPTILLV